MEKLNCLNAGKRQWSLFFRRAKRLKKFLAGLDAASRAAAFSEQLSISVPGKGGPASAVTAAVPATLLCVANSFSLPKFVFYTIVCIQ